MHYRMHRKACTCRNIKACVAPSTQTREGVSIAQQNEHVETHEIVCWTSTSTTDRMHRKHAHIAIQGAPHRHIKMRDWHDSLYMHRDMRFISFQLNNAIVKSHLLTYVQLTTHRCNVLSVVRAMLAVVDECIQQSTRCGHREKPCVYCSTPLPHPRITDNQVIVVS